MNWIKVVLFIILVAVSVGLFFYTRRKEQKRKPSRPLVTGVVTPQNSLNYLNRFI